jgi:hypothetical protein
MQSVMHFTYARFLCHDDIRAIRAVYRLPMKRSNAKYDDTCRRDFPMNFVQKWMHRLTTFLTFVAVTLLVGSAMICLLTVLAILIRWYLRKRRAQSQSSAFPTNDGKRHVKPRGYLWHDEMLS